MARFYARMDRDAARLWDGKGEQINHVQQTTDTRTNRG